MKGNVSKNRKQIRPRRSSRSVNAEIESLRTQYETMQRVSAVLQILFIELRLHGGQANGKLYVMAPLEELKRILAIDGRGLDAGLEALQERKLVEPENFPEEGGECFAVDGDGALAWLKMLRENVVDRLIQVLRKAKNRR